MNLPLSTLLTLTGDTADTLPSGAVAVIGKSTDSRNSAYWHCSDFVVSSVISNVIVLCKREEVTP